MPHPAPAGRGGPVRPPARQATKAWRSSEMSRSPVVDAVRFRDAFDEHLTAALSGHLYNVRLKLFIDWLERLPFECTQCGQEFVASANDVNEDDLIRCGSCRR